MYRTILIPVENGPADQTILDHIKPLARMTGASLLLMHVADGWVARNFEQLNLAESEEIKVDRAYLELAPRSCAAKALPSTVCWRWGSPRTKSSSSSAPTTLTSSPCLRMDIALSATYSTGALRIRSVTSSACQCCSSSPNPETKRAERFPSRKTFQRACAASSKYKNNGLR